MKSLSFQHELFSPAELAKCITINEVAKKKSRSGTFTDNMKLPVHRWFRYSAGFSAEWVIQEIQQQQQAHSSFRVLDPFAGSGTTLLAADSLAIESLGFESHPFVYDIAQAKLSWNIDPEEFYTTANTFVNYAETHSQRTSRADQPLLSKCYTSDALSKLDTLRNLYVEKSVEGSHVWQVIWLIITSILRPCSTAGTAQWQYILPNKRKAKVVDPFIAFRGRIEETVLDLYFAQNHTWQKGSHIVLTDARNPSYTTHEQFDLVITSPPYPNNYDYADATRLEMTFWGQISGWKDLQSTVRTYLVRSCSQHSAADKLHLDEVLSETVLTPIKRDLSEACQQLADIRLTKGGKKTYHTMAAAYFRDLAYVFKVLRGLCREGALLCFVIGDSAPYGIYLSVDTWLGELAISQGFQSFSFEKLRDRNTKWKNRKHRVPLKEGRLWIKG